MNRDIENMRLNYDKGVLNKSSIGDDPFVVFEDWFQAAKENEIVEPNAMTLATSTLESKPSARIVLLKGVTPEGFIFYTNYGSRKAEEMAKNPQAAVVFLWKEMERQVRIEGTVRKISEEASIKYFKSRPIKSQIGAVASDQSRVIESRAILEQKLAEVKTKYEGLDSVPKPLDWGGYILKPSYFEFWQGRRSRLHDRIIFEAKEDMKWTKSRLQP